MAKLESVTLFKSALKQEKWENVSKRKTISKLYEKWCQTGSIEELDRSRRPNELIKTI